MSSRFHARFTAASRCGRRFSEWQGVRAAVYVCGWRHDTDADNHLALPLSVLSVCLYLPCALLVRHKLAIYRVYGPAFRRLNRQEDVRCSK